MRLIPLVLVLATFPALALQDKPKDLTSVTPLADVKWIPAPGLPEGFMASVIYGNPAHGNALMLLKMPAGAVMPPHWHTADEVTVIHSGTALFGSGEKVDESSAKEVVAGTSLMIYRRTAHWVKAKTETVVVRFTAGGLDINYCDPKDDPRKR